MGNSQLVVELEGRSLTGPFALVAQVGEMSIERLNAGIPGAAPTGEDAVTQTVTIISQTGTPGTPGGPGVPGAPGSVDAAELRPDFDGLHASDLDTEVLVDQQHLNLAELAASPLTIALRAWAKADGGATGTIRVRVGGTDGQPDGTMVASASIVGATYSSVAGQGSIANPNAVVPVKLTLQSSSLGADVLAKEVTVRIH